MEKHTLLLTNLSGQLVERIKYPMRQVVQVVRNGLVKELFEFLEKGSQAGG